MTTSYEFHLEFNHSEYSKNFTHRTFLAAIDQYIDALAEMIQTLLRHYDYLLVPEKKMSNLTENTFEYRIRYRLLVPAQPPLDNLLTPASIEKWTALLTEYIITCGDNLQNIPTEEFAIQSGFRDSFLYTPVSESMLIKKSIRFDEIRQALPVVPVLKKKNS
jgi:hypothetical protein